MIRHAVARGPVSVAEIQGLYGAFSFPEKLLQKIWLRREFDLAHAATTDGARVEIVHPGKWNLLGGPDFRTARLRFAGGKEIIGDVELHLRANDWEAHAHARDPSYANVILHVVLFSPDAGFTTKSASGNPIPMLTLLPLLHHDLEEYATDEAVEVLSGRPTARLTNDLAAFAPAELKALLGRQALKRWQQKVHFARLRHRRLGWEAACHHAALETLGFRFNRAPMLRIAARWNLAAWCSGGVDVGTMLESQAGTWSLQGVRPANMPSTRLRQYQAWVAGAPRWPDALEAWGRELPRCDAAEPTANVRKQLKITSLRERVNREICGGVIGGSRLDNLVCDAFLPLLAARAERDELQSIWHHWFAGDLPTFVNQGLRELSVYNGREQPACHGLGQGLLAWLIEREVRR